MDSWAHYDWIRHWIYQYAWEELSKLDWQGEYYNIAEMGIGGNLTSATIQMLQKLIPQNRIHFMVSDLYTTGDDVQNMSGIAANSCDIMILDEVLEHVERPWKAAEEIYRVVNTGGLAIIYAPFMYPLHYCPIDVWRYAPHAYKVLFPESQWRHIAMRTWGGKDVIRAYLDTLPATQPINTAVNNIPGFLKPIQDDYVSLILWIGKKLPPT